MGEAIARGLVGPNGSGVTTRDARVSQAHGAARFIVSDATLLSKALVREDPPGSVDQLAATGAGSATWRGDRLIACLAPGEWLVIGPSGALGPPLPDAWDATITAAGGLVLDVTHARAAILVRGRPTLTLLARICAIDLSARPALSALRTDVAGVVAEVILFGASPMSLLILVGRSYGPYLLQTVLDQGRDLGVDLVDVEPWPTTVKAPTDL